ncbi:hypothetical protein G6F56_008084 [Rhizopus delemar]|nr:hypothetical protein G6F56_008084 [Rhizopus delemar]
MDTQTTSMKSEKFSTAEFYIFAGYKRTRFEKLSIAPPSQASEIEFRVIKDFKAKCISQFSRVILRECKNTPELLFVGPFQRIAIS